MTHFASTHFASAHFAPAHFGAVVELDVEVPVERGPTGGGPRVGRYWREYSQLRDERLRDIDGKIEEGVNDDDEVLLLFSILMDDER